MAGSNDAYFSFCSRIGEGWMKKRQKYFTHFVNQFQPMLNSFWTLRQYLWYHLRQCHCLHRSKHSHSACKWHGWTKNKSIPLKSREVSVVFTFNMSVKCFTPASPIALPNRTHERREMLQNRHDKLNSGQVWQFTYWRRKFQSMPCSLSTLL